MITLKNLSFGLGALASLTYVSTAHSEEVLKIQPGFAMTKMIPGIEKKQFIAIIGDKNIADFTYGPQNSLLILGKKQGSTNVIVVENSTGAEIYKVTIEVGGGSNRVQNHNKAQLNSFTVYRCTPACEFVDEVTVKEPAPLPRGHSDIQGSSTTETKSTTVSTPP